MPHCDTENDLRNDGFRNCEATTPTAASQAGRSAAAVDVATRRIAMDRATNARRLSARRLACIRIPERVECLESFDEGCGAGQQ
jgi:hypothetical protein